MTAPAARRLDEAVLENPAAQVRVEFFFAELRQQRFGSSASAAALRQQRFGSSASARSRNPGQRSLTSALLDRAA